MTTTTSSKRPPALFQLFVKAQNPLMKWLLRSPLHGMVSKMYLLITFTGRKSGKVYTTPVQYVQDGNSVYIITSEGYTWWKNLRGGADVQVLMRGKSYPAHAVASTDSSAIDLQLQHMLPKMTAEKRAAFVSGKVAVTVSLK